MLKFFLPLVLLLLPAASTGDSWNLPDLARLVVTQSGAAGPAATAGATRTTGGERPGGGLYNSGTSDRLNGRDGPGNANDATVNASVNGQINVMMYGATGNGIANDGPSINAACVAAKTHKPPSVVYFPKPSNKYLVSTMPDCANVSLYGQPPGVAGATGGGGVQIQGKPGEDIIAPGDVNNSESVGVPTGNFSIEHIQFVVDDSADVSSTLGAHRWPGRWAADGAMSASSASLRSAYSRFTCDDLGKNIRVKGAGTSGTDLVTTIASLPSCYGVQSTITLATIASTAVSGVLVYTAPANINTTQTIGNCALAYDNHDAKKANWKHQPGLAYNRMVDVSVVSTSGTVGGRNNSCGFYFQNAWAPYASEVDHANFQRTVYGVVEGMPDTNLADTNNGGDFQKWHHLLFNNTYSWISYNNDEVELTDVQIAGNYGPQILETGYYEGGPNQWTISIPEQEQENSDGGLRLEGTGHHLYNTELSTTATAYIGASGVTCDSCYTGAHLTLNGNGIRIRQVAGDGRQMLNGGLVDNGQGNSVTINNVFNPNYSTAASRETAATISHQPGYVNARTPAFLTRDPAAPFYNQDDLLLLPPDLTNAPQADSTAFGGYKLVVTSSNTYAALLYTYMGQGGPVIGTNVPANPVHVYIGAKCPSIRSFQIQFYAGSFLPAQLIPCKRAYGVASFAYDLTNYSGKTITFRLNVTGEVNIEFLAIVPDAALINGIALPATSNAGAQVVTGPARSTVNDCATFANTAGEIKDGGPCALSILQVASGRKGTFVCTAGGTVTITNANELATSDVIISLNAAGGAISTPPSMKTVRAGIGFTVLCGPADTSTYNYDILD